MITKTTFINTMNRLQKLDEKLNVVDNALKDLSPDFGGLYIPDFFDITIEILQEAINDKHNWLVYFVYERDWLRNIKLGDVTLGDVPIQIETWEDVYDFIAEVNEYETRNFTV